MTMKITRLQSHWNTAEAWTVIEFLDGLRGALWEDYGEQITEMCRQAATTQRAQNTDQYEIQFEDDEPF